LQKDGSWQKIGLLSETKKGKDSVFVAALLQLHCRLVLQQHVITRACRGETRPGCSSAAFERKGTKIAELIRPSANPSSQGCPGARHFASHQMCTSLK